MLSLPGGPDDTDDVTLVERISLDASLFVGVWLMSKSDGCCFSSSLVWLWVADTDTGSKFAIGSSNSAPLNSCPDITAPKIHRIVKANRPITIVGSLGTIFPGNLSLSSGGLWQIILDVSPSIFCSGIIPIVYLKLSPHLFTDQQCLNLKTKCDQNHHYATSSDVHCWTFSRFSLKAQWCDGWVFFQKRPFDFNYF